MTETKLSPCSTINIVSSNYISAFHLLLIGKNSRVDKSQPLHLLQKKALRIVANQDYISHSGPICKALNLVKVPDMYTCAVWNFCCKLMNNLLPLYFENCKPTLPRMDQLYNVRNPVFHLPKIKHEFAEQHCQIIIWQNY